MTDAKNENTLRLEQERHRQERGDSISNRCAAAVCLRQMRSLSEFEEISLPPGETPDLQQISVRAEKTSSQEIGGVESQGGRFTFPLRVVCSQKCGTLISTDGLALSISQFSRSTDGQFANRSRRML